MTTEAITTDHEARLLDERRIVEAFATHGAAKLAARRHHGRWVNSEIEDVVAHFFDEMRELHDAIQDHNIESARAECIDVALTVMILRDRLGQVVR